MIKLKKDAVFPELVADGISKWYLFDYDRFLEGKIIEVIGWAEKNKITTVRFDIYRYFEREDFIKFKTATFRLSAKRLIGFLNERVLDEQPRELFLETAFISDDEKVLIYLDKPNEVVLIGITDHRLVEDFEKCVSPYSCSTLSHRIDYIFDFPLKNIPNINQQKKILLKNYFENE